MYWNSPRCMLMVNSDWHSCFTFICLYALAKSSLVYDSPLANVLNISSGVGKGYVWECKTGLTETLKSPQILIPPSFLWTTTMGVAQSLLSTGTSSPASVAVVRLSL